MHNYAVVLPTIRPQEARQRIVRSGIPFGRFIVVEDLDTPSDTAWPKDVKTFSRADLPPQTFSTHNSAIRCFGFLKAYQSGADFIITFDDDVAFHQQTVNDHLMILTTGHQLQRWMATASIRTRGLPWRNTAQMVTPSLSHGLWTNIPDFDAPTQLLLEGQVDDIVPFNGIIPIGLYYPMCWMNLAFTKELVPMMYAPFNGPGYFYDRFEDIWTGIISKKIMDHLQLFVHSGMPTVEHERLSDVFVNLQKEAPGIHYNETFWQTVDSIHLTSDTPTGCMLDIAKGFDQSDDIYLKAVANGIRNWLDLL